MLALLDGDIITYRVGFTTLDTEPWIAIARTDESIRNICQTLGINEYKCFLTSQDKSNYRFSIDPEYKANRKDAKKPTHYTAIREHLIENHGAEIVYGCEADDRMGILQSDGTIICTIDKDLDQIPGWHFNFVKGLKYNISPMEGIRWFYHQLLVGETSENIQGIRGIGKVKATACLHNLTTEEEMFEAVAAYYKKEFKDDWLNRIIKVGRLLWIQRKEGEMWLPPNIEVG